MARSKTATEDTRRVASILSPENAKIRRLQPTMLASSLLRAAQRVSALPPRLLHRMPVYPARFWGRLSRSLCGCLGTALPLWGSWRLQAVVSVPKRPVLGATATLMDSMVRFHSTAAAPANVSFVNTTLDAVSIKPWNPQGAWLRRLCLCQGLFVLCYFPFVAYAVKAVKTLPIHCFQDGSTSGTVLLDNQCVDPLCVCASPPLFH
jgi:hypothetical protein